MSVQVSLPPYCSSKLVTVALNKGKLATKTREVRSLEPERMWNGAPSPPTTANLRRDGLTLSFNRSISEPHAPSLGMNPPCLSPPSVSPSLHPSKRSRMGSCKQQPDSDQQQANSFLRPPPKNISPTATVSLPASPCRESSTLQKTLLLQKAKTISADNFATRLSTSSSTVNNNFILIDCRPFITYNVSHIKGAINVNCCDRFNRKRLQHGKVTLAELATTQEGKELLKERSWKEVFVYDDCSESLEKLPVSHALFLVMNALVEDHREPVLLLGGLRDFQVSHRAFCEDHLRQSSTPSGLAPSSSSSQPLPNFLSPSESCFTKDIEKHPVSQILSYLFLGNMKDAADANTLKHLGIKYVLNVTDTTPAYQYDPEIIYKQLEAADNGIQNLRQFFGEAFDFIDKARVNHSGVLIHCKAGISRSPTIAVAYLMKHYPMAMSDAYKFVKTCRSIISPNLNFMGQLYEFEQMLMSGKKSDLAKEPLTVEMKQFLMTYGKNEIGGPGRSQSYFKWSDANQQPNEDDINSGCSI